jgi:hypothetical protein
MQDSGDKRFDAPQEADRCGAAATPVANAEFARYSIGR